MSRTPPRSLCLLVLAAACGGPAGDGDRAAAGTSGAAAEAGARRPGAAASFVEGTDYVVLERVRILDETGFDQPVEAMSVLVPRGWRTEGSVRWKGVGECRGEIVTWSMTATSPEGAIRFMVLPVRSFGTSQDPMLRQAMLAAAQQGDCAVGGPFDARQHLQTLARTGLDGATVSDIRDDESQRPMLERLDAQSNAISRQYATGGRQAGSAVFGSLTWPDGSRGLANVGVTVTSQEGRDLYGAPNGYSMTTVFHQAVIRFPAAREAEALRIFATITTSHRVNPMWQQAKERFLTQLGNVEHAGRMERIRLMGEQSAAYARAQGEASDARMRDWERAQASSDAGQRRFIQTIREVETWKAGDGSAVELGAGYSHGWSRPDGAIVLTNNSSFDPAVALQQDWVRMQKVPQ